jgi:hypothetical protein
MKLGGSLSYSLDHILNQKNAVYTLSSSLFKIHFNIIFPYARRLPSDLFQKYFYQILYTSLSLVCVLCALPRDLKP